MLLLNVLFILWLLLGTRQPSISDDVFAFWRARIFESNDLRLVIIDPVNWCILNNTSSGQIYVLDSTMYHCKTGSQAMYVFGDQPDSYKLRCWSGNLTALLSAFENVPQLMQEALPIPPNDQTYTVVDAINALLDAGLITNSISSTVY